MTDRKIRISLSEIGKQHGKEKIQTRRYHELGLMLIRKSQRFDVKEIWLAQQAIDINAQRMSGQLAVKNGYTIPERCGRNYSIANCPDNWPLTVSINIGRVGWGQFEVQNHTAHGDQ